MFIKFLNFISMMFLVIGTVLIVLLGPVSYFYKQIVIKLTDVHRSVIILTLLLIMVNYMIKFKKYYWETSGNIKKYTYIVLQIYSVILAINTAHECSRLTVIQWAIIFFYPIIGVNTLALTIPY